MLLRLRGALYDAQLSAAPWCINYIYGLGGRDCARGPSMRDACSTPLREDRGQRASAGETYRYLDVRE